MNRIMTGAITLIFVGTLGAYVPHFYRSHTPGRSAVAARLPHDNFSAATQRQIQADLRQYNVAESPQNHEVYRVTGGIGAANPAIVSWGNAGNMTFELPHSGETYRIEEMATDPLTWHYVSSDRPVRWQKYVTQSGQVYYGHSFSGVDKYFFKKGSTYIVVMVTPAGRFPRGLIDHLQPVGNPVIQS